MKRNLFLMCAKNWKRLNERRSFIAGGLKKVDGIYHLGLMPFFFDGCGIWRKWKGG